MMCRGTVLFCGTLLYLFVAKWGVALGACDASLAKNPAGFCYQVRSRARACSLRLRRTSLALVAMRGVEPRIA